jgi:mannose-6-phosphate isomerase
MRDLAARRGYLGGQIRRRSAMSPKFESLPAAAAWFDAWLTQAALPLWAGAGLDAGRGGFQEALTLDGAPAPGPRRSRVQTRQVWVYATAARSGLGAGYGEAARGAWDLHQVRYRRADGRFARAADPDGGIVDGTAELYDQAFALLALAALEALSPGAHAREALALLEALAPLRHAAGGYREEGERPFQANALMHLFEAALAWEAAAGPGARGPWASLAGELAGLALTRFIDPATGAIREFFDAQWEALPDPAGGLLEPGHQFEWATLLDRWGEARGRADARAAALRLHAAGMAGVDPARGIAAGALWSDLTVRDAATRLWAQTEHLKAALVFGAAADALRAAEGLALFLETPVRGLWRDRRLADGSFAEGPAPATSLYHLLGAILPLRERA